MDEIDRFVQDGVFTRQAHNHLFTDGETKAQREEWLREIQETCREAGIEYVVREIDKDGKPGYQFGFADISHYIAFVHNVYGDLEGQGGHSQTHTLSDPLYRDAFRRAAEMHLRELGIKYRVESKGNDLHFAFDRFSDRMTLLALIENGTLDASAQGLAMVESYRNRIGLKAPPQPPGRRLDF